MQEPGITRQERSDGVAAPSVLLWMIAAFFLLVILTAIAAFLVYKNSGRIASLIPIAAGFAFIAIVGGFAAGVIFRKQLPRRFLLWLVGIYLVLGVLTGVGGLFAYTNVLPPRFQQEILTQVPFMRSFLPPTPSGGIVPTAEPVQGDLSAQDLLNMPIPGATEPRSETIILTATSNASSDGSPAATATPSAAPPPASSTPTATSTPVDPATPTVVSLAPTQNVILASAPSIRPASGHLFGMKPVQQTWNNCGPANITEALSYYGWAEDQDYAAQFLKPEKEDKNVSPGEMVAFVNEKTGVKAITRIGGDMELLKTLLANNFPVLIETGYMPEGYDWIGHYQTLVGYDDTQKLFYIYDTFLGSGANGEGVTESYNYLDTNWQAFNRTFIVIYKRQDEGKVAQILGDLADPSKAAERALAANQADARANPQNAFAWFNMGTALTKLGRDAEAAVAYDRARQIGLPWRMTWYQFGPFEAYFNVGRYDDVLSLAQANLTNAGDFPVEETFYWQGKVYGQQGKTQDAINAFRQALKRNPHYADAQTALGLLS
jgi:tetratricopeptide (TPR) repeat protein